MMTRTGKQDAGSEFDGRCRDARCRSCGREGLEPVLDLGLMPLADRLVREDELTRSDPRYPLEVAYCADCSLLQVLETVPGEILYDEDYLYFSSFSDALLRHSRDNALELIERCALQPTSLVVELASNDGYLLKNFVERGIGVLGIDPARGPGQGGPREKGIEMIGVTSSRSSIADRLASEEPLQAHVIHRQ